MANAGIFVGFGTPVRGRERKAVDVFNETVTYYARLQEDGEIESFEPVFLEPHGGDLGGFFLLRGNREKLAQVRASEEFQHFVLRASLVVEGLGVVGATLGEDIAREMGNYQEQVAALT